ncbi:MAG TPA: D-alanyl-D-alanine carboxypeptidase family protein [Thermoanaerobaculia bacterium]|nr:D-alanyl-D-alanine carboxypeptidase family protein [Thermoanaerobaculia bacterium]
MTRRCTAAFLFALAIAAGAFAQNVEEEGGASQARTQAGKGYTAALVMDMNSRRILFEDNIHTPFPTASMAKMMTLLIVMEEIRDGRLQWDTAVTVSPRAANMGGSQVYLRAGSVWPVKNLVIATMVHSANDAAQALAERVAGSSEAFADLMNDRAQQLGLKNSRFVDPHGLPPDTPGGPQNVMSAHDLAVLGIELMKHPFMRQLAVIAEMPFRNGTLERIYNPNRLVNPSRPEYYADATGIKTGYSAPAGYCITASAKRGDIHLVAVVMGAATSRGPQSSFGIASRLMNRVFLEHRVVTVVKKGTPVGQVTVANGRAKTVQALAGTDVKAMVERGSEKNVKVSFSGGAVNAPVRQGQAVGTVVVQQGHEIVARIPAVASSAVSQQSWWRKFWPF